MAWKQTLLEASFRGVVFDIVKTDDVADRSLVEHSYPYVDGSDVEDMGRGARHVSVEAIFYGDDYEARLQSFLAVLDQPGAGELVHPVFGSIKNAQAAKHSVHHDADGVDQATVAIEFIESTPGNPFFSKELAAQKTEAVAQHGAAATAAANNEVADVVERTRAAKPFAALDGLRQKMAGPLLAAVGKVNASLSGLDVLAYPRAWGNDVSALVGGILDVRDFGSGLMADWASVQSDLTLFDTFSAPPAAPAQITSSAAPTEDQAVAAAAATIRVNTAVGLADAASLVLASEADTPTLSPVEIEAVTNTARTAIESAIEQVRGIYGIEQSRPITEPLKDQGLALQEAARAIIEARPPLIWRTVEAPGNFRLLAHLWYGDHTRAPELYRMNGARSPFAEVGDRIHAYAR